ncbi:hypothetical protein [Burkholderia dolosa]|uniref:hypothetical protein n=1 Tax=Burkholderia dolosa TaxID=152500 RepID=UPI0036F25428
MGGIATGESGARANVPIGVETVDFDDLDASLRYSLHAAVQTVQGVVAGHAGARLGAHRESAERRRARRREPDRLCGGESGDGERYAHVDAS